MKRLLLPFILVSITASAQFAPSQSGSSTAAAELNSKAAIQAGSGAPSVNCTAGKDFYVDTTGHVLYICVAANTWVQSTVIAPIAPNSVLCNSTWSTASPGACTPAQISALLGAAVPAQMWWQFGGATIGNGACSSAIVTFPGAIPGQPIKPGWPPTLPAGVIGTMTVTTAGYATVQLCNFTGSSVTTSVLTYKASL
jgi:hypothetical protein